MEDEDVGVVNEDTDGLGAVRRRLQHVAAEGDVCLSMGDDTAQLVDQLDVVWKGAAAQDVVEQTLVRGIVKNSFSAWKGC